MDEEPKQDEKKRDDSVEELKRNVTELLARLERPERELADLRRERLEDRTSSEGLVRAMDPSPRGQKVRTPPPSDGNQPFVVGLSSTESETPEPCLLIRGGVYHYGFYDDDGNESETLYEVEDEEEFTDFEETAPFIHVGVTDGEEGGEFFAAGDYYSPNLPKSGYSSCWCLAKVIYASGNPSHIEPRWKGGDIVTAPTGGSGDVGTADYKQSVEVDVRVEDPATHVVTGDDKVHLVGDKDVGTLTGYPYYYGSDGAANENRTFHQLKGQGPHGGLPDPGEEYQGIYTIVDPDTEAKTWEVRWIQAK